MSFSDTMPLLHTTPSLTTTPSLDTLSSVANAPSEDESATPDEKSGLDDAPILLKIQLPVKVPADLSPDHSPTHHRLLHPRAFNEVTQHLFDSSRGNVDSAAQWRDETTAELLATYRKLTEESDDSAFQVAKAPGLASESRIEDVVRVADVPFTHERAADASGLWRDDAIAALQPAYLKYAEETKKSNHEHVHESASRDTDPATKMPVLDASFAAFARNTFAASAMCEDGTFARLDPACQRVWIETLQMYAEHVDWQECDAGTNLVLGALRGLVGTTGALAGGGRDGVAVGAMGRVGWGGGEADVDDDLVSLDGTESCGDASFVTAKEFMDDDDDGSVFGLELHRQVVQEDDEYPSDGMRSCDVAPFEAAKGPPSDTTSRVPGSNYSGSRESRFDGFRTKIHSVLGNPSRRQHLKVPDRFQLAGKDCGGFLRNSSL